MQQNNTVKILGIAPYAFLPAKMGGQKGIEFFYRYLGAIESVTVVSVKSNAKEFSANYQLIKTFGNNQLRYANPFNFFRVRKILREQNITHLIAEHPYMGWLAFLLKRSTGLKLIVHSHNIEGLRFKDSNKWWWKILWNYECWVHRRADLNFFITAEDKVYAQNNFRLKTDKCVTITYGTERSAAPALPKKINARQAINSRYNLPSNSIILLFNGTLNYQPNLSAVDAILQHINPRLLAAKNFSYKIIICGKNLPDSYNKLYDFKEKNIVFAGFVEDINEYFLAADIFINPVIEGGGIKTKLVEALGYNLSVVSTASGAIGIPKEIAGDKLTLVNDNDWSRFASAIINSKIGTNISVAFFNYFYWGNIVAKASAAIRENL